MFFRSIVRGYFIIFLLLWLKLDLGGILIIESLMEGSLEKLDFLHFDWWIYKNTSAIFLTGKSTEVIYI